MPTDFIYLRSVKARIRLRDKVKPCNILLWTNVYA